MKKEIIGKNAEITTNNKTFIGKIVDETKNTIHLKTKNTTKIMLKNTSIIKIEDKEFDGKKIMKRPEERIKAC
jgi:RNase P/RNase MRP subunit p29